MVQLCTLKDCGNYDPNNETDRCVVTFPEIVFHLYQCYCCTLSYLLDCYHGIINEIMIRSGKVWGCLSNESQAACKN